jgi:hypothetical protein
MKARRQFIRRLGGLTAFFAMATPGRAGTSFTKEELSGELEGNFVHVVFFWLKDDTPETKKKFLSEAKKLVDNVDVIKTKHIGTPADTDRDVIDNTWSFSLVLSFDSKKEQDIYQEHQTHLDFIENASSLWEKVLVYDSVKTT